MAKGTAGKGGRAGRAAPPPARKGGAAARAVPPAQNKRTSEARRGGASAEKGDGRAGKPASQPAQARRQAVAANTAALAAQPKRVLMQKVPVDSSAPQPWKVVLTRLVGEFADETAARALFAAESRVLAPGEHLTIIKDGRT